MKHLDAENIPLKLKDRSVRLNAWKNSKYLDQLLLFIVSAGVIFKNRLEIIMMGIFKRGILLIIFFLVY